MGNSEADAWWGELTSTQKENLMVGEFKDKGPSELNGYDIKHL